MEQHFVIHPLHKLQASPPATSPNAACPSSWLGHNTEPSLPFCVDLDTVLIRLRDQPFPTTLRRPCRSCVSEYALWVCRNSPQRHCARTSARSGAVPGWHSRLRTSLYLACPQKHSDCSKTKLIPHGHGDGTNWLSWRHLVRQAGPCLLLAFLAYRLACLLRLPIAATPQRLPSKTEL